VKFHHDSLGRGRGGLTGTWSTPGGASSNRFPFRLATSAACFHCASVASVGAVISSQARVASVRLRMRPIPIPMLEETPVLVVGVVVVVAAAALAEAAVLLLL